MSQNCGTNPDHYPWCGLVFPYGPYNQVTAVHWQTPLEGWLCVPRRGILRWTSGTWLNPATVEITDTIPYFSPDYYDPNYYHYDAHRPFVDSHGMSYDPTVEQDPTGPEVDKWEQIENPGPLPYTPTILNQVFPATYTGYGSGKVIQPTEIEDEFGTTLLKTSLNYNAPPSAATGAMGMIDWQGTRWIGSDILNPTADTSKPVLLQWASNPSRHTFHAVADSAALRHTVYHKGEPLAEAPGDVLGAAIHTFRHARPPTRQTQPTESNPGPPTEYEDTDVLVVACRYPWYTDEARSSYWVGVHESVSLFYKKVPKKDSKVWERTVEEMVNGVRYADHNLQHLRYLGLERNFCRDIANANAEGTYQGLPPEGFDDFLHTASVVVRKYYSVAVFKLAKWEFQWVYDENGHLTQEKVYLDPSPADFYATVVEGSQTFSDFAGYDDTTELSVLVGKSDTHDEDGHWHVVICLISAEGFHDDNTWKTLTEMNYVDVHQGVGMLPAAPVVFSANGLNAALRDEGKVYEAAYTFSFDANADDVSVVATPAVEVVVEPNKKVMGMDYDKDTGNLRYLYRDSYDNFRMKSDNDGEWYVDTLRTYMGSDITKWLEEWVWIREENGEEVDVNDALVLGSGYYAGPVDPEAKAVYVSFADLRRYPSTVLWCEYGTTGVEYRYRHKGETEMFTSYVFSAANNSVFLGYYSDCSIFYNTGVPHGTPAWPYTTITDDEIFVDLIQNGYMDWMDLELRFGNELHNLHTNAHACVNNKGQLFFSLLTTSNLFGRWSDDDMVYQQNAIESPYNGLTLWPWLNAYGSPYLVYGDCPEEYQVAGQYCGNLDYITQSHILWNPGPGLLYDFRSKFAIPEVFEGPEPVWYFNSAEPGVINAYSYIEVEGHPQYTSPEQLVRLQPQEVGEGATFGPISWLDKDDTLGQKVYARPKRALITPSV